MNLGWKMEEDFNTGNSADTWSLSYSRLSFTADTRSFRPAA